MQFRTQIPILKSNHPIDYTSKIVSLGSCFAVNIAEKLNYFKFESSCNPFGILFHPEAIKGIMNRVVHLDLFTNEDLFFYNDLWHCFEIHSEMSHANDTELLQILNYNLKTTRQQILEATHIIITYGTSWVYRHKELDLIVANCHKVSQNYFEKKLLTSLEIHHAINETLLLIQSINPKCSIVLTISPVRHLKDGFIENQQSKANLIIGIHKTITDHLKQTTHYFPSYEIMMDELRDYRFYAEDMLHPNAIAINYIWEQFIATWILEETKTIRNEVDAIQKSLIHKAFNPNSKNHQQFILKLNHQIESIQKQFPNMNF